MYLNTVTKFKTHTCLFLAMFTCFCQAATAAGPVVGLNIPGLALDFIQPSYRSAAESTIRLRMGKKAVADAYYMGAKLIVVRMPGWAPVSVAQLHRGHNDLALWQSDPNAYWRRIDSMIHEIAQYDMQIMIRGTGDLRMFPALTGETTRDLVTNPNSRSFALYKQYWGECLARYKDNPAIALYEPPGEMNLSADLDQIARCHLKFAGAVHEADECSCVGNYSTDEMNAFSARLVAFFKQVNPSVHISSDMGLPRSCAEHLRRFPEWDNSLLARRNRWLPDSLQEFTKNLTDINAPYDYVDVHSYNDDRGTFQRFGYGGNTPVNADLLQLVGQIATSNGKQIYIGEFGDCYLPDHAQQTFTKSLIAQFPQSHTAGGGLWSFEFYPFNTYELPAVFDYEPGSHDDLWSYIGRKNREFGHRVYQAPVPNTIPPQVIISYPFNESSIKGSTLLNVLASTNSGKISRVEIAIDGAPYQILTKWPFRTQLQAAAGPHHISATAYDTAGNWQTDAVDLTFRNP